MKIYIASGFNTRLTIRYLIEDHPRKGIEFLCSWALDDSHINANNSIQSANKDIEEVELADALIVYHPGYSTKGGLNFEMGYAHALKKPIIIIGSRTNVFTHLFPQFEEFKEGLDYLETKVHS